MKLAIKKQPFAISIDSNPKEIVFICSHERSGTHFLMNSLGENSNYDSENFTNFDYLPLGDIINFYSASSVKNFLRTLTNLQLDGKKVYCNSILKSHHSVGFFQSLMGLENIKFLYICRDPVETLISFWRLLHSLEWNEGLKAKSPLDLARAIPSGQLTRYQWKQENTHFSRWANHVNDWLNASKINSSIKFLNYRNLNTDFEKEIEEVLSFCKVRPTKLKKRPDRDKFIHGKNLNLSEKDHEALIEYVNQNLNNYPELKSLFQSNKS